MRTWPRRGATLLTATALMLSASILSGGEAKDPLRKRPNVLLILVDDLRPALGAYGDGVAITPALDKLAAEGMRFDAACCNQAVCAPSRYNLLLGSRSTSTGIYDFGRNFRDFYPDAVTLPQHFGKHGYHTESMGKVFHIGHNTYNDPASWTQPHHAELLIEYVDPESTDGMLTREEALFQNRSWDDAASLPRGAAWESPDVEDEAYADGRIARRTVERLAALKQHPDRPFFVAVGFARPHLPFSAPKRYWDLYDPAQLPMPEYEKNPVGAPSYAPKRDIEIVQYKPIPHSSERDPFPEELTRKLIHGYYASTSFVDAQIGKVLQGLDEFGPADNTIIVLWGDHGFHLGELGIWTKHVNYELANRIPLLIVAPGVTKPGSSTGQLTETVDIYPTLVELAGLPAPETSQPIDGISLVPVLRDPRARIRDHAYHAYGRGGRMGRAIRTERYRMVEWKRIGDAPRTAEIELYDYSTSRVERQNLADELPEVVADLRAILNRHPEARAARPQSNRRE